MNELIPFTTKQTTTEVKVFIILALIFFSAAILFVIFILISRLIKNDSQQKEAILRNYFQRTLNAMVIMETTSTVPASSHHFKLDTLRTLAGQSSLARQVMVNQLVAVKKSISGSSSKILEQLYIELDLHTYSIKKLKRGSWQKKAQGIRELAELRYQPAIDTIRKFIVSGNRTLREESLLALVRLDDEAPLSFLDQYTGTITPWMRINIHYHLSKSDARKLPHFSRWFSSSNLDVVLFALSMARQFRQSSAIPFLTALLSHTDTRIAGLALETISALEAHELADDVTQRIDTFWANEKLSTRMVRCLGRIGYTLEHKRTILRYLDHPDYTVRFNAVQAMYKLDDESRQLLLDFNTKMNGILSGAIEHVSEPLLL